MPSLDGPISLGGSQREIALGYDPGGNGSHGVAALHFERGQAVQYETDTCATSSDAIAWLARYSNAFGLGVDTLTYWSTGKSGWRDSDLWLRKTYPTAMNSVVAPNSLYGSMVISGMSAVLVLRALQPELMVTEAHPKVLVLAIAGQKYNYEGPPSLDDLISEWLGIKVQTKNEHEWDAAASALAAFHGRAGHWPLDLTDFERGDLVFPAGPVNYWWPG